MIDIRLIRDNPSHVKKNYLKRRQPELLLKVDAVIEKDQQWRKALKELETLNQKRNKSSIMISKAGNDKKKLVEEVKAIKEKIDKKQTKVDKLKNETTKLLMRLPNLIHDSVPYGKDDSENVEIKTWGKKRANYKPKSHVDIITEYDLADMETAAKVSGARFYYLKGDLVKLDYALQNYVMDQLMNKGFTLIEPPQMLRRGPYEGVTDLADFEDVMYKIEGEDLYLIATSEHPLAAMHMDKIFYTEKLPLNYAGISSCFRKEAGAHGKDTKGIFRVHRFNKVEQFVFCKPEDSWRIHEELLKNEEEIIQSLGIPYRIVNICTGDLGIVAAKKYDIESWMPVQGAYRELTSCSNCTDYQARRLNIKYLNDKGEKEYVHTLNGTGIATSRAMVAIIENFQEKDGAIKIPTVLHSYMNGVTELRPKTK
ncbi:MAG: serine--tRNA ligase [Candidatus Nanoarchaeia archaeon]|jgi:seryl-tRNA synthetase